MFVMRLQQMLKTESVGPIVDEKDKSHKRLGPISFSVDCMPVLVLK